MNDNNFNGVNNTVNPNPVPTTPVNPMQPQMNGAVPGQYVDPNMAMPAQPVNNMMQPNMAMPTQPQIGIPEQPQMAMPVQPNMAMPAQPQMNTMNTVPQNDMATPVVPQTPVQNTQPVSTASPEDEALLQAYIGKNYEKISKGSFNVCGFFFSYFYMFYRKMFLYGLGLFIVALIVLNVIDMPVITTAFNVLVGFGINKIYLANAKKKIEKIKAANAGKSLEELKTICASKGGTSVGLTILGTVVVFIIAFIVAFIMLLAGIGAVVEEMGDPNNWEITVNGENINDDENYEASEITYPEDDMMYDDSTYDSSIDTDVSYGDITVTP